MPLESGIRCIRGRGLHFPPGPLEPEHVQQLRTALLEPEEEILWHEHIPESEGTVREGYLAILVLLGAAIWFSPAVDRWIWARLAPLLGNPGPALQWTVRAVLLGLFALLAVAVVRAIFLSIEAGWHYLLTTQRLTLFRGTQNPEFICLDLADAGVIVLRGEPGGPGHMEVADKVSQRGWFPRIRLLQATSEIALPLYSLEDISWPYHLLRRQCRVLAGVDDRREISRPQELPPVDAEQIPEPLLAVLDEDEQVLWYGRPSGGEWRRCDAVSLFFGGVLLLATAVFLNYQFRHWGQMAQGGPWLPVVALLAAVVLLGIGGFLCVGPFFWPRKRATRYHYLITNQRVVVLHGFDYWPIRSLERPFGPIRLRLHSGDRGTFFIGEQPTGPLARLLGPAPCDRPFAIVLLKVPHAQAVLELLQRLNRP